MTPGQNYRQGVAVPPGAFPPMFLLSMAVCRHVVMEEIEHF